MNNKTHIIIELIAALVILVLSILLFRSCSKPLPEPSIVIERDTTYLIKYDTVKIEKPKYITKYVIDTLYLKDTVLYAEQKTFEDTISTIWISGINAELDSVHYRIPKEYITIENTTTITRIEKKHWNWGIGLVGSLGASTGYDPLRNQASIVAPSFSIGVGIGIFYTP